MTGLFAQNQRLSVGKASAMMNESVLASQYQNDNQITIRFDLNELELVEIETDYGNAFIATSNKAPLIMEKGAPELFFLTSTFMIPDNSGSELKISSGKYTDFKNIEIAPSKGHLSRSVDPKTVPFVKGDIYRQNRFYPEALANLREPFIMRDVRGQSVEVYPVQYNPVTKVLRVYSEITVTINNNIRSAGVNEFTNRKRHQSIEPEFRAMYDRFFINNAQMQQRGYPTGEEGDILVICHTPWVNDMKPYVDWKRTIGRKTTIIPTSAITPLTAANIKTYISDFYNNPNNNLAYVLLVGDHQQIPPHAVGSVRSDVTYGKLVGNDDYLEVLIGRFSAETSAQVQTQVQRTIHYERDLSTFDTWLSTGIGVARDEGNGRGHDGGEADHIHMNNIRNRMMTYGYTPVWQEYDDAGVPNTNPAQINSRINAGAGFLNYCNHGYPTAWLVAGYSTSDVSQLQNVNKLPFIHLVACNNGEFGPWQYNFGDAPCLAEVFMRHTYNGQPAGAIAAFGATISIGWQPPMTAQDESVNSTLDLSSPYTGGQSGILRTIAGVWLNGTQKMLMQTNYNSLGMQSKLDDYNSWLVFGDPSLMIRTKTPQAMAVSHNPTVTYGASTFSVSCNVNGALVAISYTDGNNEVQIMGIATVSGGVANLTFTPIASTYPIKVTITGRDRVTYQGTVSVQQCTTTTNFMNQIVTTNKTITGCEIIVQNVTVQNNAKLTIDASNETKIEKDFEVQLGSELEIK